MTKKVLIVSPQASRLGHGAFHGQRTLAAFSEQKKWETIFLTGSGFRDLSKSSPLYGEIIEAPINIGSIGSYRGNITAIKWGIRRMFLLNKLNKYVDNILKSRRVDVVFFLDGDVNAIYRCWLRNRYIYPDVGWVIAHGVIDFWFSEFSVRSIYKQWVAQQVKRMTEEMGATILYLGPDMAKEFCRRLDISKEASERIVLTDFGCDEEDMRQPISNARNFLKIPSDVKVALFFGLIRPDKRPDIAIRAVAENSSDWWLLIAGKPHGYQEDKILDMVHSTGLGQRSRLFLRYLDENEVRMVFSAADILLLPHDRSIVSNSGVFSMSRSYRLPVIASDVGSLGKIISQDGIGLVAPPADVSRFAEKIREFGNMSNSETEAMKDRIQKAAQKKGFSATVRDYTLALDIASNYSIPSLKNDK